MSAHSQRLNPLDASWIYTESRATPNHVGGLLQFKLPDGAPRDFLRQMMADFRGHRVFKAPWNRRLKSSFQASPLHTWVEDDAIDLEYHVRHAALPWPGGERELGELVGRLHSTPIDLARPPWECTIIEGLEGNRFGLYIKMHHSLIDGVSGMKLLQRAMSFSRDDSRSLPPFWASGFDAPHPRPPRSKAAVPTGPLPTMAGVTESVMQTFSEQAKSLPSLASAFGQMFMRVGDRREGLVLPFDTPISMLNGRVREKRRFATAQFAIARLRAVAKASGATLNDVVLAISGGALRRFLDERGALPDKPLTAGIPVSVRPADDEGSGNAISFIVANLGTDVPDAADRLETIKASVKFAKDHVQSLPRQAMLQYTMLLMAPTIVTNLTPVGGRTRPMFNVVISNVPGPDKPMYFRGAELTAVYPASIVTHGQALNITCESYNGFMNFGFTACHTSVPSIQRLAVYAADALDELEEAYLRGGIQTHAPHIEGETSSAPDVNAAGAPPEMAAAAASEAKKTRRTNTEPRPRVRTKRA